MKSRLVLLIIGSDAAKKVFAFACAFIFINQISFSQLTWTTVSIPMRDSTHVLAADYYVPPGCTSCPVILIQTPYNKNSFNAWLPLGIGNNLANSDYAFVIVDWRGFNGSAAAATANPNRGEDGYDCVEWISQQSWCDGNIGTWGPSALGKVQYETAREQHPNHKCAVPLVADPVMRYEDYFPGGVYRTEYVQQLDALGYGMSTFLLANTVKNISWNFVENQTTYPASINIPVFMIGGWFDHNVDGMLEFFDLLKTQSPVAVRDKHKLLMGPWCHGGSGAAYVGSLNQGEWQFPNAAGEGDSLALKFFDYYLRNLTSNEWTYFDNYDTKMYETSSMNYSFFDPADVPLDTFYLTGNNYLTNGANSFLGDTTLVYDPRDPSPTVGGPTLRTDLDQGPYDQIPLVESRNDIAHFDLYGTSLGPWIYGKPELHLFVSSDRKDTDFAARLTIIQNNFPIRSIIIADGITRLRFRDGFTASDTAVGVPGNVYEIIIRLPHISYTLFDATLRLDVTCSNYPRFDANLNNGGNMYVAGDTLIATNTIYYNQQYPSYLLLPAVYSTSVEEVQNDNILVVFPNPASNELNLNLPYNDQWKLHIIDLTGKTVSKTKMYGKQLHIDIETLPAGSYILEAENKSGEILRSKFIKQ